MKLLFNPTGWFIALAIFMTSCNEPTIIGSGLLENDRLEIGFTDTLSLSGQTIPGDSVRTYDPSTANQLANFLCGQFVDPIFGTSTSVINAQFLLNSETPDFDGAELDSIVLILPFTSNNVYGDTTQQYRLDVFELSEDLDNMQTYFSNQTIMSGPLIGSRETSVNPNDSTLISLHGEDPPEFANLVPQFRIRLDDAFGENILMQDTSVFENDSTFLDIFKGIQIRPLTANQGMLAFNLISSSAVIRLYYHKDDEPEQYAFGLNTLAGVRMASFTHDRTGSVVEPFINEPKLGDSLLFLQAMAGVVTELEIANPELFEDKIINLAELELNIIKLDEDNAYPFDPIDQIVISEVAEDGTLSVIQDAIFAASVNDLDGLFGGTPEEGNGVISYRMIVTSHLRKMADGLADNKIVLSVVSRGEKASRVVLCGPKHPEFPSRLKVNFTEY
jgi:hypothetical protein